MSETDLKAVTAGQAGEVEPEQRAIWTDLLPKSSSPAAAIESIEDFGPCSRDSGAENICTPTAGLPSAA
jgi:hypothetical protein